MFVKVTCSTFLNPLRVLSVLSALSGFILLTAALTKIFVTVFNSKLLHSIHEITVFLFLLC